MSRTGRRVIVSGSLAYDKIFTYPKRFRDALILDKIHLINVSFSVATVNESFGGTAGNIAYSLALLGIDPVVLGSVGNDFERYRQWMVRSGVTVNELHDVRREQTASFSVITDRDDNQIGAFHAGALLTSSLPPLSRLKHLAKAASYAILAPGNIGDMVALARFYRTVKVPYLFDPGQMLTMMSTSRFSSMVHGAQGFISNDYELSLALKLYKKPFATFVRRLPYVVTTRGPRGSRLYLGSSSYTTIAATPPHAVVDPTGAGDAYRAGLVAGVLAGRPLREAARWGSVASAYTVERQGTQTHQFTRRGFSHRLQQTYSH